VEDFLWILAAPKPTDVFSALARRRRKAAAEARGQSSEVFLWPASVRPGLLVRRFLPEI
jgi:hypothetical protein